MPPKADAILFDLDGTLLDTAQDLIAALNKVLTQQGKAPLSLAQGRPYISTGAAGLIGLGMGDDSGTGIGTGKDHPESAKLQQQLVEHYRQNLSVHTELFAGMGELLNRLDQHQMPWGIVTNKITALTQPLLKAQGLFERAHCLVCRDTTAEAKPSPAPLLHACKLAGLSPENTLYIGDSINDIKAAKRAGMISLAARYGYLPPGDDATSWAADGLIDHPKEISNWLNLL